MGDVRRWWGRWRSALPLAAVLLAVPGAHANPVQFPRPPQLEPDIRFWQRIYSKVTTQGGLLHDDRYLDIVYEEMAFPAGSTSRDRGALVDTTRSHYESLLRRLAAAPGEAGDPEARRVLALFPANVTPTALEEAADHVRFQLGQADRFREGLIRSGTWGHHVEETLRREGLPAELSALPHVESSFNPRATSKVGAAGLWQFMRSTGKRWLRVDGTVDERLDPYKSTLAAAQFLNINYSILGSWPLAVTAYNHGAGGMRHARETMGTDDIVTIVRGYQSRTFGFASRNFYVSFLAALEIDRNPEKFFGHLERAPGDTSRIVRMSAPVPVQTLEKVVGADRDTLRALNLSLLDPVWAGRRPVPRGFELHVPAGIDPARLVTRLGTPGDGRAHESSYLVKKGDTIDRIATTFGIRTAELVEFNGLADHVVHAGAILRIPPETVVASATSVPVTLQPEPRPRPESSKPPAQPVSRDEAVESAPGLLPGVESAASADPSDYSVSDGRAVVLGAETLSQFAEWLGVTPALLRQVNNLPDATPLAMGRHVKLDFSVVDAATFVARRTRFHHQLQDEFFRHWRVAGQEKVRLQAGESLWTLTHRSSVPIWLLRQYNPAVNFTMLHAGTEILLPKLEAAAPASASGAGR
jgi:membrane-bound lytic murein transglycosylase D